jgi:Peptidase family M28/PA domain
MRKLWFLALVLLTARISRAQISTGERELLDALDPTAVVSLTRRLSEEVGVGPSGAGYGSAAAGSAAEKALADFIEKEMRGRGFEVTRERFPVRAYEYGEVRLEMDGSAVEAITLHSSTGTWGVRDGVEYANGTEDGGRTLRARLVDAGRGLAADYGRIGDVSSRIVLVQRGVWPSATALEAAVRGARAVIFYDYPGENPDEALKQDGIQYHDDIPAVSIAKRDAARIRETLKAGEVEVSLSNQVDVRYGVSENVIGRLTGREVPDEFVAVTSHHDRWHQGAQDNAVGVAVMLELGRVLRQAGTRRTLLLVAFGAEEAGGIGTQSDWLVGSYAFVKNHPEIASRLAYAFNVDGAGFTADKGHLFATVDNLPFQRALLRDLNLESRIQLHEGVTNWVDAWSLGAIGGGAVSYLLWFPGHPQYEGPASFSRYYHTQLDVYRASEYQNLDADLTLGALGLYRADRAQVLPIAFEEIASWLERTLDDDARKVPSVSFKEVQASASVFARAASRVAERRRASSASEAARWNRLHLNVRHELVPWLLSTSSSRAVLKTSPHASDLAALSRAREAIDFGDAAMASSALEEVTTADTAATLSEKSYYRERLFAFGPASWGNDFEQDIRPVSPELFRLYQRVRGGSVGAEDKDAIRRLEAQARGHLEEAILLISGKLREAAARLE